jgi:hypothetical protein
MNILDKYKVAINDVLNEQWFFHIVKRKFFSLPISVRIISLSSFLFVLWWWLGADTFFSIYIKMIVDNIFWVAIIWWWLSAIRLFFTIPIGKLDDHASMKSIIFLSKFFYVISGMFYFFAGILWSLLLLIVAVIFNWFASATLFTTYQSYIRNWVDKNKSQSAFSLFFSSFNFAYVVWALISAIFIDLIDLEYVFLFIVLFSIVSFFSDKHLPETKKSQKLNLFWKKAFLYQFFRESFSLKPFKDTLFDIKSRSKTVFVWLRFEFLFGILNYILLLFIPIISLQNNLSLGEVAIIFAIMRLPYVVDFVFWGIMEKYNKQSFIMVVLLFVSLLFTGLFYVHHFVALLVISFLISFWLALIRPVISAITTQDWGKKTMWSLTGAEQFVWRFWDVVWAVWFGILSSLLSVKHAFLIVWLLLFLFSFSFLFRKLIFSKIGKNDFTQT